MSELIVCPTCQGKKIYIGIGMVKSKCAGCNAIGWISKPIVEKVEEPIAIESVAKPIKQNIKPIYKRKCR